MTPSVPSMFVIGWSLQPLVDLCAVMALGAYWTAARKVRAGWPVRRTLLFALGLVLIVTALSSGLARYDDQLLSAHMVQHLLLLAAPLPLLAARPLVLALRALPPERRPAAAARLDRTRPLLRPLPCLLAYSGITLLVHLPAVYDLAVRNPTVHELEHLLLICAAMLLWWPLCDADPLPSARTGGLVRLGYAIAAMVPMAIVGAPLTHADSVVYSVYSAPARALGVSAVSDQQTAGAIMWVLGSVLMSAVALWVTTTAMMTEERRQVALEQRS